MGIRRVGTALALLALLALLGSGSAGAQRRDPPISGTWRLEAGKVRAEGPRTVIIRADSSASWGKETVRWRLKDDRIMIALGGEWEIYKVKIRRERMTLSGGDLQEQITLRRIGPPTPRPDSIPVPPDPGVET